MNTLKYLPLFIIVKLLLISCANSDSRNELNLPKDGFDFKLNQRDSLEIPSLNKGVKCFIDDITAGQTQLIIESNDKIVLSKSISDGEKFNFQIDRQKYIIQCDKLINLLIGNDFGYFKVTNFEGKALKINDETKRIVLLLEKIEQSEIIFIRNGTEYDAKQAAEHLHSKWNKTSINNVQEFIEKVASTSSTTNESYKVKLKNGTIITSKEWLIEQSKENSIK